MARYLIVNSRDWPEPGGGRYVLNLARNLRNRGHAVTVFLVEDGAHAARAGGEPGNRLSGLAAQGVRVLVEEAAVAAEGLGGVSRGIMPANLDVLADLIATGSDKVVWY